MLGTQPHQRQPALFAYRIDLEHRVAPDHLLRQARRLLDLSFVVPAVRHCYGRSGHVSLDPQVILKMMLLLFLYDIRSERELMEQIRVRLDFLWFLGFDLESEIPNHSVLSKARARWGEEVFEELFTRMVQQCVQAGLVDGSLLHVDSTIIKAQASRDSVVSTSPELVSALRQAYQQERAKLEVLPDPATPKGPSSPGEPEPPQAADSSSPECRPEPAVGSATDSSPAPADEVPATAALPGAALPSLQVLPSPVLPPRPAAKKSKAASKKLPVNRTHISTTDPEAELARNKSGVSEPNFKEHRMVDDAHGVITAVASTSSNVHDGSQLPGLYEQHLETTGLKLGQVTLAGDHHYGTASNYIYCEQAEVRAHLADASANVEERGLLPLSRFVYEPELDRLCCPQGHYLVLHQNRPEELSKVYLIEDPAHCAGCALRKVCTKSKLGRSIQRHVQAELVERARAEANSEAGRYSRKRRWHVMEGSFAHAFNQHGAKKARWRGLSRQRMQSWLIATVQNLRILLRHQNQKPAGAAAVERVGQLSPALLGAQGGPWASIGALVDQVWSCATLWGALPARSS